MIPSAIRPTLDRFVASGLLTYNSQGNGTYLYSPSSPELEDAVRQCYQSYSTRRMTIIEVIFSAPIQHLADAFKLKHGDD
ncbi:MAG: hypothetical protein K2W95_04195 [Candidatus Obscuribacterales bacterium]|nr:hypothetical protein [Candidatus Obscuribacterales bacterium]